MSLQGDVRNLHQSSCKRSCMYIWLEWGYSLQSLFCHRRFPWLCVTSKTTPIWWAGNLLWAHYLSWIENNCPVTALKSGRGRIFSSFLSPCGIGKNYCSLMKLTVDNLLVIGWTDLFLVQWGNLIAIHKISNETVCKIKLQLTVQCLPLTFTSIANDFFPHLPSAWSFLMIGDCNERKRRKVQGFHFVEAFFPKEMAVAWGHLKHWLLCIGIVKALWPTLPEHCDLLQLMDPSAQTNYKTDSHF